MPDSGDPRDLELDGLSGPDDTGALPDDGDPTRREAEAVGRRYRFLAKAIPQIIWTATPSGMIDSFNPRWTEYTGLPIRGPQRRAWIRSLHDEDIRRWLDGWKRARSTRSRLIIDLRLRRVDGQFRWHLVHALPALDRSGRILKWLGTCTDIDDQKRAEGMLGFLAEVSKVLAGSLDYEVTLEAVARLAVPHVADWCVVDMLEPTGATRRLAVAHRDPKKVELAWEISRRYPPSLGDPRLATSVLRTGRTEIARTIDDHILASSAKDETHLAMLREQGCTSAISAALTARGRTLGVITFAMAESQRYYSDADLPLVEDLARRAAMAVDNARLYREAQQAREEAESANRAKDRFLAVLSHELRTPLTPVLAEVAAMLDDPNTPESVRSTLAMTRRNVELEARLIDDLLDLNRIVQGKLRLKLEEVDVHRLVNEALGICRVGVEEAALHIDLALEANRYHVQADSARLEQVIWNLIKNAVKFTPHGGFISIRTSTPPEGGLQVQVSDTGVGIESDVIPRIFDAFEQGESSVTQQFGGLGLGLAISRSLAEAHGGTLTASSPGKNQGASFVLHLPPSILVDPPAEADAISRPSTEPVGATLRILLVEDNADTLRVMSRLLMRRGHQVTTAESVASATKAVLNAPFDLLVSDLGLPDGSGLDLIRKVRQSLTQPLPAIALSGYGLDEDLRHSREAGFVEHLIKPLDFATLEQAIHRVMATTSGGSDLRPALT